MAEQIEIPITYKGEELMMQAELLNRGYIASDFVSSKLYDEWGLTLHEKVENLSKKLTPKEALLVEKTELIKKDSLAKTIKDLQETLRYNNKTLEKFQP